MGNNTWYYRQRRTTNVGYLCSRSRNTEKYRARARQMLENGKPWKRVREYLILAEAIIH